MYEEIQRIEGIEAVITEEDDVALWDVSSSRIIVLEDAQAVRTAVDDDIAERITYET